ncbi:Dyp-type peroxidase [Longimicrobium sp.]|uniref:Dyp-type peroxidase n=1 Tax=Longimicrobium sp. TaxID=2029185 RepID=UPI002B79B601|nr:Dyp-type peroxidase [Longimicrobium sp.]HSU15042.1 Dyp-type peroxidase [Longimicrobium sp.]
MSDVSNPAEPGEQPPAPGATQSDAPAGTPLVPLDIAIVSEDEARRGAAAERAARRERVAQALARTPAEDLASAAKDGRTSQSSLLVMPRIKSGHMKDLLELLDRIARPESEDIEVNPIIPFARLRTVHFMRILVHQPSPSKDAPIPVYDGKPQADGPEIPAKLLFSTDFDGPLEAHFDELLREAGPGLDQVFGHCEEWPGHADRRAAHAFFMRHRIASNTFYTGTMHRSVDQIRREAHLRDRVEAFLDAETAKPDFPGDPLEIRRRILAFIGEQEDLKWTAVKPGPYPMPAFPPSMLKQAAIAIVLLVFAALYGVLRWAFGPAAALWGTLGVAAAVAVLAGAAVGYLFWLAAHDPVIVSGDVKEHTADLVRTEDRIVQNEMSSVIYIKRPLWFRGLVLRAVLKFIDLSAKYLSNQGNLAGIPSIHFARWVIVDGGRRLVFFSNFDGSWDNYLGDFIDKSHNGLTAVWSNCVGFPRTTGLFGGGATNEQQFKAYSRDSQIPTQVWYSAYRWLSVSNINNNSRIRLGLYEEMDAPAALEWLRRFADGSQSATSPTAPAEKPVVSPAIEVADVQGLVARSYKKLGEACYVPVYFADPRNPGAARAWVGALAGRVTPASKSSAEVEREGRAVNVGLTFAGVQAMGLDETTLGTFGREFIEGMTGEHRQRVLGDTGPVAPGTWTWGGPHNPTVHAMLFLFAATADGLRALLDEESKHAAAAGATFGAPLGSAMLAGDREHFGFHDGIAQPRIDGLRADADAPGNEPKVPAGEVVLGYPNAYGNMPATPSVPVTDAARKLFPAAPPDPYDTTLGQRLDLGKNGSYVVFRQMEQDVKAFWSFMDQKAGHDAVRRKWLAARMVGRWPNGTPLEDAPDQEPAEFDAAKANAFLYAKDLHGERCPLGSHIRRTNPRDGMGPTPAESLLVADRHRLLRRGRAYGPPLAASYDPADILASDGAGERGLHFICFNTDIGRQFEFVQSTWVNSMKFDGLYSDPDPVIAPHRDPADPATHAEEVSHFTVQRCPVRHRVDRLPRFVTVRGGAYLFMPGIKALGYLSDPR